jgi:hypothetical protein
MVETGDQQQITRTVREVACIMRDMSDWPATETPSPELVASWPAIDTLAVERVPLWAAHWIVAGDDGQAQTDQPAQQFVGYVCRRVGREIHASITRFCTNGPRVNITSMLPDRAPLRAMHVPMNEDDRPRSR